MDELGLVEAVDRLGQSVVVAITDAADLGFDGGIGASVRRSVYLIDTYSEVVGFVRTGDRVL
jgi:hypothetical protein